VSWQLVFSKAAQKDAVKIKRAGLQKKTDLLLDVLETEPFSDYPPYEKLIGDLDGFYSRRINIQHRLVYRIDKENHRIFVDRMWTRYD
jgi:Txe/YoeB family toxin of toxin-antitoxin system